MSDIIFTTLKWPSRGSDFNIWYTDLSTFARLLDAASDLYWWTLDSRFKYINTRIDTRNGAFLVFAHDHADKSFKVSPDEVLCLIIKYLARNKPALIERFQRASSFEEIIEIIERRARQTSIKRVPDDEVVRD